MPQISIIIPIYNIETYLPRCLDSVLSQTYTNWEAILVDDGSKDGSGNICDEYAKKDGRFRVIHKENGGVSSARNKGLEDCRGQWCCFVDSDDWLDSTYLQNFMVDGFDNYGCVIQGFFKEFDDNKKTKKIKFLDCDIATSSELAYILEKAKGVHNGFLWHRIFKVKIIKDYNILFPIGVSYAEDGVFFLNYILYSSNFRMTSKTGYYYWIRNNSLTSQGEKLNKEKLYNLLELITNPTIQIIAKDKAARKIENGLKLYIWRLLYIWILRRNTECKEDYIQNMVFLAHYFENYPALKDVDVSSFSLIGIINIVSSSPSTIRYYVLRILIRIYYVESRLRRKLNSIL